jgi:uncharacterized membrane protein
MGQLSADTLSQLLIGAAILLGLIVGGVLLVQRFRGSASDKGGSTSEVLSSFQEMRQRGDISDADYRRIKSVLGGQLQGDVKRGKDKA